MSLYAIKTNSREELRKYSDKWVAVSTEDKTVIACAKSPREALEKALSKGEKDPILTRIPKRFDSYVL